MSYFSLLLFAVMGERKVSLLRRKLAVLYLSVWLRPLSKIDLNSTIDEAASAVSKKSMKKP